MTGSIHKQIRIFCFFALLLSALAFAETGDVDNNGAVDLDDARQIARYLVGQIPSLEKPENGDVNYDDVVDMQDAFTIAMKVTGKSRIVVASPRYGIQDKLNVGQTIRIEVFEKFAPYQIQGGTVRIVSASTGYDTGELSLIFERDGRSLYYHWDTSGLTPASDYQIFVHIYETSQSMPVSDQIRSVSAATDTQTPSATVSLTNRIYEPPILTTVIDAYAPAPGIPLIFKRVYHHNHSYYPYLGPLGRGWVHNYDVGLEEYSDGRIIFRNPEGCGRSFKSNMDGTYTSSPGDYGSLTRDLDGSFTVVEKSGIRYHFHSNLKFDFIEDRSGNRITGTYNDKGYLTRIQHSSGQAFTLEYNNTGRIARLTDHAGRATVYEYEPKSELLPIAILVTYPQNPGPNQVLAKVTNAAGDATKYSYLQGQSKDILNYRLSSIEYPDGTFKHFEYDDSARLKKRSEKNGWYAGQYSYDADGTTHLSDALGNQASTKVNDKAAPLWTRGPDGALTQMEYNAASNMTGITDPRGNKTLLDYDEYGNIIQTTDPLGKTISIQYDLRFQKPYKITNQLGITTENWYDDYGNLKNIVYIDESKETFTYDTRGNMLSSQDGEDKTTAYTYNNNGQAASVQDASGHTTQFSYDTAGQLKTVINAKSVTAVSHEYDALGRVTKKTYPDNSFEAYTYNAGGNITSFVNRRGETIQYEYNFAGQLEWKRYPGGKACHYLYNTVGTLFRVERVVGDQVSLEEEYELDSAQRVTKSKTPGRQSPQTYDVSYAYDLAGNRTLMAYPDGYVLHYEYDALNRLIRIYDSQKTIVAYEYDVAGRRIRRTLGNGTYTVYEYSVMNYLTKLTNHAPDTAVQSSFEYTYNKAGMRTSMKTQEGTHNYTYDNTYQLTSVTYPDSKKTDYQFDAVGNRTSVTENGQTTNYTPNNLDQYTQVGNEFLEYDFNGNLTQKQSASEAVTYSWNEDDRLIGINRNGTQINYEYDHQRRLLSKTVNGNYSRYVWDGWDLIAEIDASGNLIKRYIYGNSINEIILVSAGGNNYWCQQDGLGNVIGSTNTSGQVLETATYDIYGGLRTGNISNVPQRFAGMMWDSNAELYYAKLRFYDPTYGKFLQVDPVEYFGANTLYTYVKNNPANFIDPLGLKRKKVEPAGDLGDLIELIVWFFEMKADLLHAERGDRAWWYYDKDEGEITYKWVSPEKYKWLDNEREGLDRYGPRGADYQWWDSEGNIHYGYNEGMCPTFIQPKNKLLDKFEPSLNTNASLIAEMPVPSSEALLRSDIPIYGIAGGKDFKKYRVEYGEGKNPKEWHLIESSDKSQTDCPDFKDVSWMQGDLDLKGNLATWNTGLKNWVHLPWHAPEDTIDLNGVYTIRLVVEGKDGKTAEDRVTCEVGRAIAQCLPGIAISPDKKVTMYFGEQSLTSPFRVYTILPFSMLDEEQPAKPQESEVLGDIYRIREPGDRFAKEVRLEFAIDPKELANKDPNNVGIYQYDVLKKQWVWINTWRKDDTHYYIPLTELPTPKAVYAIQYSSNAVRSRAELPSDSNLPLKPVSAGALVDNSFEKDAGTFKNRDKYVGAVVSRDNSITIDKSYCLKLSNENFGGNFSSTVLDKPFDVRQYGTLTFDYNIGPETRVDFFLKVDGRWYCLRFTGEPVDYCHRDVNIANLGQIEKVITDKKWHTASVDLRYLLGQQTRHTVVEEIMMANWVVEGYMKLAFGENPRNTVCYLDNVKITGPGAISQRPDRLLVCDFDKESPKVSGTYCTPGAQCIESAVVPSDSPQNKQLQLAYNMSAEGLYGGYWISIKDYDLNAYHSIDFKVYTQSPLPAMQFGIRSLTGHEGKTFLTGYAKKTNDHLWDVSIPLNSLLLMDDLAKPDVLFFAFNYQDRSGKGKIGIDDIVFTTTIEKNIADFENSEERNILGGALSIHKNGAAAISGSVMPDITLGPKSNNHVYRVSYGGSIGKDYGTQGGFSYCAWRCDLRGLNAGSFKYLSLKIRGENGQETPNFYVDDSSKRICLRAKHIPKIQKDWQTIKLPLEYFSRSGIDLSYLTALEMVFEWEPQSGTIYVDDICLE